jgi:hypothetical protein
MEADLQYAGDRAKYGWTHGLDIVWGHLVDTCR